MRFPSLLATLALGIGGAAPVAAQASDPPFTVTSKRDRVFRVFEFAGKLPDAAKGKELSASLCRSAKGAQVPLLVTDREGEAVTLRLRTQGLLVAGDYQLAFRSGGKTLALAPVSVGTPAEAKAAAKRMDGWYSGALTTFRELTASLERRGAFHLALAKDNRPGQGGAFGAFLVDEERGRGWTAALIQARMDLAVFARRLVIVPRPRLHAALLDLAAALAKRRDAWSAAIEGAGRQGAPDAAPFMQLVSKVVGLSPAPSPIAAWEGGPMKAVPVEAKKGSLHKGIGFQLSVPGDADVSKTTNPVDRLVFSLDNARVIVQVREHPDDASASALIRRLEISNWETWDSYRRLSRTILPGGKGFVLDFTADLPNTKTEQVGARILQRSLFPPGGRRSYSLLIVRANTSEALSPALVAVVNSFGLRP